MLTLYDDEVTEAIRQYLSRLGFDPIVGSMAWYPTNEAMTLEIDVTIKIPKEPQA